ncbi:VWA domain-containing protein [Gammaproteobacteria bacterium]|nr:VWA domain-containing protein [Gammaproteobacteria bacterium]
MIKTRRSVEEFSISFLDVICCGFGAVILLLMSSQSSINQLTENTIEFFNLSATQTQDQLNQVRDSIKVNIEKVAVMRSQKKDLLSDLEKINQKVFLAQSNYETLREVSDQVETQNMELAEAKQSLTKEMERLLGANFRRRTDLVGGITVDSEYIIFVIDTSGSMQAVAWPTVIQKVSETLSIYPSVKGIQVLNDMGDYMFSSYKGTWMQDSPAMRTSIISTLSAWSPFSNSSPVEGIREAIYTYYDPNKNISIYVFGDDYTGNSIEAVVDAVDQINVADESGNRRVRIHAVGFPVYIDRPNQRVYRFASLMRELAYRNNGTFVALSQL